MTKKTLRKLTCILLAMVLTVSTFVGVQAAGSVKQVAVTGRVAALDNHVQSGCEWDSPEQIGFSTNEVFPDGNWVTCGITSGSILKNDVPQSGWTLQTTGTSGFVVACWGYIPVKDDVIKIPAGTQFGFGGVTYEISADYHIKYDGTSWATFKPADAVITVTGRVAGVDNHVQSGGEWSSPEQIGFTTNEVFPSAAWITCGITAGNILKNDVQQSGWSLQTLGTSGFVVACWGYIPVKDDVIKIPAGLQFSDGTAVYEISEDYNVKYDGSMWHVFAPADAMVTITGRVAGVDNHVQSGNEWSSPEQIGFTTNEVFPSAAWVSCGVASGSILKNDVQQSGWTLQTLGTSGFVVACWGYIPAKDDVIKIPAGLQFTDGAGVYEISKEYYVKYDGSMWHAFVPADAMVTITGRAAALDHRVDNGGEWSSPEQIGFTTDEVFSASDWITCGITGGNVWKNDVPQNGWTLQTTGESGFVLACWGYVPRKDDVIKMPAGTQFAYGEEIYEFSADYCVKYDGATWNAYVPADAIVNITGRLVTTDGASPVQIGFTMDGTFATGDWITCEVTGGINLNDANRGDWTIQTTGTNSFNLVCWNYAVAKQDVITIPAGTRFTYSDGKIYEFATDYSVKYDGAIWNTYVPADELISITGRLATTDGASPVQIGFTMDGTFASEEWITCGITGGVLLNGDNRGDWMIQTTGANSFNLVCWNYEATKNDIIKIPAETQFTYSDGSVFEFAQDCYVVYDGETWVIDKEGPEFYLNGIKLKNDEEVSLKNNRHYEDVEDAFSAIDTVLGTVEIFLEYEEGMIGSNGLLQIGEWNVVLKASDACGYQSSIRVVFAVEEVVPMGDFDGDGVVTLADLIRLLKVEKGVLAEGQIIADLDGNGMVDDNDKEYMRRVLVDAYHISDGVCYPYSKVETAVTLFADYCPRQDQADLVDEYFDAGFTHIQMTEDYIGMLDDDKNVTSYYKNVVKELLKSGKVIIRNQGDDPNRMQSDAIAQALQEVNPSEFFYDDEPSYDQVTALANSGLVEWHNQYFSNATFHVNLLPSYGFEFDLVEYEKYIKHYKDSVLSKVEGRKTLSIDHYPLRWAYSTGNYITSTYLFDLLLVANTVRELNEEDPNSSTELSLCIQSYNDKTDALRDVSSVADISFQTNIAIAMGARSLDYFAYDCSYGGQISNNTMKGIVNGGKQQVLYESVKIVNKQIQAWDHVFTAFAWQGATMLGEGATSLNMYKKAESQFSELNEKVVKVVADQPTIVSEFLAENSAYACMVVNATEPSKNMIDTVSMTFENAVGVIVHRNGEVSVEALIDGQIDIVLAAGEGAFCIPLYR